MQNVVDSNPISRLRKGLHLQAFLLSAAGWIFCFGSDCGTRTWSLTQPRLYQNLCI